MIKLNNEILNQIQKVYDDILVKGTSYSCINFVSKSHVIFFIDKSGFEVPYMMDSPWHHCWMCESINHEFIKLPAGDCPCHTKITQEQHLKRLSKILTEGKI